MLFVLPFSFSLFRGSLFGLGVVVKIVRHRNGMNGLDAKFVISHSLHHWEVEMKVLSSFGQALAFGFILMHGWYTSGSRLHSTQAIGTSYSIGLGVEQIGNFDGLNKIVY